MDTASLSVESQQKRLITGCFMSKVVIAAIVLVFIGVIVYLVVSQVKR